MNETKIQQLTWSKGMTNVPSDMICDDNTCETEVNMIYRLGEHRAVQNELVILNGQKVKQLLLVHKQNGEKRYIALKGSKLIWYDQNGAIKDIANAPEVGINVQVEAIGNTLIALSEKGMGYYLWKQNENNYKYLGAKIPEPKVKIGLYWKDEQNRRSAFQGADGIITSGGVIQKAREYTDLMVGMYSDVKNTVKRGGGFLNPFFLRYAVEMFDGEHTGMSVPILLYPYIDNNMWVEGSDNYANVKGWYLTAWYRPVYICYKMETDYTGWEDLVKGVSFFVSSEVDLYKTDGSAVVQRDNITVSGVDKTGISIKSICLGCSEDLSKLAEERMTLKEENHVNNNTTGILGAYRPFEKKSASELKAELSDAAPFYTLCSIGRQKKDTWTKIDIKSNTLTYLETQTQAPDDYYSHCDKTCTKVKVFNKRLHMSDVTRGFWGGGDQFVGWDGNDEYSYEIYTYIHTGSGDRVVRNEITSTYENIPAYIFYPDPRAYRMDIYRTGMSEKMEKPEMFISIPLDEHQRLNGAYYIGTIPGLDGVKDFSGYGESTENRPAVVCNNEYLGNELWVSEVNNPWVFTAKGTISIGNGVILSIASMTTALSQGQFGQYPLTALCTDGVWALQIGNDGMYTAVRPMSREVCNNPQSVTETDGLVFFTSEKGLMMISGGQITCVSEQLSGRYPKKDEAVYNGTLSDNITISFKDFLRNCFIAYDYRDSLLWIINDQFDYLYLYSIKDGTFAVKTGRMYDRCVNDYPDTLLQSASGEVYSLLERDDINFDGASYTCELITRPMKWENSTALKTLSRIKMIYDQNSEGKQVSGKANIIYVYASNDCKTWTRVKSLRGRGFKYWKFVIQLKKIRSVDAFSGVLINTQERYTNRIR